MNYAEIQKEPLLMELWGNESKALKLLKGKNTVNAFDIIEKDGTLYVKYLLHFLLYSKFIYSKFIYSKLI